MKFYDCATAPSPRRVRMFIAEKGLDIPVVEVDLAAREQHEAEFAAINPFRTVPVLELDDGTCLTTSTGICHYLEFCYPEPPLMGRTSAHRGLVIDLDWRLEQEGFMAVGEAFRNKARSFANNALTGPHTYNQIEGLVERGKVRTEHFFDWLNERLKSNEYVAGDFFSIADITALATVDFSKYIKVEPQDHHVHLQRWHNSVSSRPSARL